MPKPESLVAGDYLPTLGTLGSFYCRYVGMYHMMSAMLFQLNYTAC